jgi:hypothetical protein
LGTRDSTVSAGESFIIAGRDGKTGLRREVGGASLDAGASGRIPAGFCAAAGVIGAEAFFEGAGTLGSAKAVFAVAGGAGAAGGVTDEVGGLGDEGAVVLRSGIVGSAGLAGFAGAFASAGGEVSAFSAASAPSAEVMGRRREVPFGSGAGIGAGGSGARRGCSGGVARRLAPSRCEADAGLAAVNGGAPWRIASDLEAGSGLAGATGVAGATLVGRAGMEGAGVICAVGASPETLARSVAAGRRGVAGAKEVLGGFAGVRAGLGMMGEEAFLAGASKEPAGGVAVLTSSGRGSGPVAGLVAEEKGGTETGVDFRAGDCAAAASGAGVRRSEAVGGRTLLVGGLGDVPAAGGVTRPVGGFADAGAAVVRGCAGVNAGGT